jgi:two-component system, NtrC family, nitrogen regulation sensor histidine kinase NtrY
MIYRNFRLNILVRVTLIVSLAIGIAYVTTAKPSLFIPIALVIALIVAVVNLVVYIERSNKDLTRFLLSLRQGAFTESFRGGHRGKPFEEFSEAMNEIIREFAKLSEAKELHYQYLETLNEKISVAICSFDTDGKLIMMNPAAKQLIRHPSFSGINDFRILDPKLGDAVASIKPDERIVVKAILQEELYQLSVQCKEILLKGNPVKIILLQNLNRELETKEIEAWHQLIRVLTHEIMNSVTPIISLTDATRKILTDARGERKDLRQLNPDNAEDIYSSIETINSRSKGLLKFVNSYREYAKPVELHVQDTDAVELVTRVVNLLLPEIEKSGVRLEVIKKTPAVMVRTDIVLMEQVVINLIKNALEAVSEIPDGKITVSIEKTSSSAARISVDDNGPGIDPDIIEKIFIPFYTTKQTGSGIGLSFSRQILRLHEGSIRVNSVPGRGTSFIIEWK